mmetsp:Transcript_29505/g.71893  ORF Transcript_29505/g.71893 Transcript_29505/m.71893 type:complete len:286 (+) Transcript_29505:237-1094(+)
MGCAVLQETSANDGQPGLAILLGLVIPILRHNVQNRFCVQLPIFRVVMGENGGEPVSIENAGPAVKEFGRLVEQKLSGLQCDLVHPSLEIFNHNRPWFLLVPVNVEDAADHMCIKAIRVHGEEGVVVVEPEPVRYSWFELYSSPILMQRQQLVQNPAVQTRADKARVGIAEDLVNRAFLSGVWELLMDCFPQCLVKILRSIDDLKSVLREVLHQNPGSHEAHVGVPSPLRILDLADLLQAPLHACVPSRVVGRPFEGAGRGRRLGRREEEEEGGEEEGAGRGRGR